MFKKIAPLFIVALILLAGCTGSPPDPTFVAVATLTPTDETIAPTETSNPSPESPTATLVEAPSAVPPTNPPVTVTGELAIAPADVTLYPVPQLYTGDRVTIQLTPDMPVGIAPQDIDVHIYLNGELFLDATMGGWMNLAGEVGALYQWVWDVGDVPAVHTMSVVLDPKDELAVGDADNSNNRVDLTVEVLSAENSPTNNNQGWQTTSSAFANIHFATNTAAARDQAFLISQVDSAIQDAAARLQLVPQGKIDVYFVDRVVGQGGYASNSVVISYLDRNYAGGALYEVLVHESIHILDNQFFTSDQFRFIAEGMAVWGAGGHYKPENLDQRMASLLLDSSSYVGLIELTNNFYTIQHEIGYLEAGSFFGYLVQTFGWDSVQQMLATLQPSTQDSLAQTLSDSMVDALGRTLPQLELDWHNYLRAQPRAASNSTDLSLTIAYYDLVRRYQQAYDPTAYFLSGWLPSPEQLRRENLTSDLTRHPTDEVNIVFELMLESADIALRNGDFDRTRGLLDSIERSLNNGGRFIDPLAANYQTLVRTTIELGYTPEEITILSDGINQRALVFVTTPTDSTLIELTLALEGQKWIVSQ